MLDSCKVTGAGLSSYSDSQSTISGTGTAKRRTVAKSNLLLANCEKRCINLLLHFGGIGGLGKVTSGEPKGRYKKVSKTHIYAGRVLIYSAPVALLQHIEWALNQHIGHQLGQSLKPQWVSQPLLPGLKAGEITYDHHQPIAAQLVKALMSWRSVRCEIFQIDKKNSDAILYRVTPDLGLHQASLSSNGDIVLNENLLTRLINQSISHSNLKVDLHSALGTAWEIELEPYRLALASGVAENISNIG